MQFGELKLKLWNFDWLPKNQYNSDLSENFITQTRRQSANFPTSFLEFGNRMQKLQNFELDLKVCEDNIGSLRHLGLKFSKGRI